ncbi:MAG: dihydroneopterin aldolase [Candidatus Eremiobacterota bacterium]
MADRIVIRGLQADCIIGLAEWERMVKQTVSLTLALDCDVSLAARHDRVVDGVLNTRTLSKRLQAYIAESEFQLIETLAERLAELILAEFPVRRVRLKLAKPGALRGAASVAVHITRSRAN